MFTIHGKIFILKKKMKILTMANGGGALGERNPLTCTPPGWGTYRGLGGLIYEMILNMMWGK